MCVFRTHYRTVSPLFMKLLKAIKHTYTQASKRTHTHTHTHNKHNTHTTHNSERERGGRRDFCDRLHSDNEKVFFIVLYRIPFGVHLGRWETAVWCPRWVSAHYTASHVWCHLQDTITRTWNIPLRLLSWRPGCNCWGLQLDFERWGFAPSRDTCTERPRQNWSPFVEVTPTRLVGISTLC